MLRGLFSKPHPVTEPQGVPVHAVGDAPRPEPALAAVLDAAGMLAAEAWARALEKPCRARAIWPGRRLAAFAATIAHESAGGQILLENMNYSAAGLRTTWPSRFSQADAEAMGRGTSKAADQWAISERAYGGRMGNGPEGSGDGYRYRGRGLIQLTGRDAFRRAGEALGLDLEDNPEQASQWGIAAEVAAWAWSDWKRCNDMADRGDVEGWRRAINGGLNGLEDVRRRYQRALQAV